MWRTRKMTILWINSFELTDIIDKLRNQNSDATHYVICDACRDELKLTRSGKSVLGSEKDLVPVANASGGMIAYATAPRADDVTLGSAAGPAAPLAEDRVRPASKL